MIWIFGQLHSGMYMSKRNSKLGFISAHREDGCRRIADSPETVVHTAVPISRGNSILLLNAIRLIGHP
jgi:hypothetical protein